MTLRMFAEKSHINHEITKKSKIYCKTKILARPRPRLSMQDQDQDQDRPYLCKTKTKTQYARPRPITRPSMQDLARPRPIRKTLVNIFTGSF